MLDHEDASISSITQIEPSGLTAVLQGPDVDDSQQEDTIYDEIKKFLSQIREFIIPINNVSNITTLVIDSLRND